MTDVGDMIETPWNAGSWDGATETIGNVSDAIPTETEVKEVLFYEQTPDAWDGDTWGLCLLNDGRLCAWQSWWGPTGSGFHADAYGGNAVVYFSAPQDIQALLDSAWDEAGRRRYMDKQPGPT